MSCEKYQIKNVPVEECIGDSLEKINDNFFILRNAYCDIRTELNNRLRVMNQGIPLPEYTETIVFSGTRVSVRVTPGDHPWDYTDDLVNDGTHKTVFIPITGVTQIIAGNNITIESTEPGGLGEVTVNYDLPPRPKQIRTFMYYEDGNNNTLTRPSYTRLQNFINNNLKIGQDQNLPLTINSISTDISRESDEVYIVYFKTARNRLTVAPGGSQTYTGYKGTLVSGPVYSGGETHRPSYQYISSKGEKQYTVTWPSDTADRSVLVTITYKFRFTGTEYVPIINDETGAWPKYSYSLHQAPDVPGLAIQPAADTPTSTPDRIESVVRFYSIPAVPFVVPANVSNIQLLVVGGGGGGGVSLATNQTDKACGGGGGGGVYLNPNFIVRPGGVYDVIVGAGGQAGTNDFRQSGGNSEFTLASQSRTINDSIICRGGGAGANGAGYIGSNGASGGGASGTQGFTGGQPGTPLANTAIALPQGVQGFTGGTGAVGAGGGGGGAAGPGGNGTASGPGAGGAGFTLPETSLILANKKVAAGGAGGRDIILRPSFVQPQDPSEQDPSSFTDFKYGCGGGAGKNGNNGLIGVAYTQIL